MLFHNIILVFSTIHNLLHSYYNKGIDSIVLGCTHYPYAKKNIQKDKKILYMSTFQIIKEKTKYRNIDNKKKDKKAKKFPIKNNSPDTTFL